MSSVSRLFLTLSVVVVFSFVCLNDVSAQSFETELVEFNDPNLPGGNPLGLLGTDEDDPGVTGDPMRRWKVIYALVAIADLHDQIDDYLDEYGIVHNKIIQNWTITDGDPVIWDVLDGRWEAWAGEVEITYVNGPND